MRALAALLVLSTGCTAIFGLEAPRDTVVDDAAAPRQDGKEGQLVDARLADAMLDGPPDDAAFTCPSGFASVGGSPSKFLLVNSNIDWLAAEADCESRGSGTHLVIVDDESARSLLDAVTNQATWIGLSDRVAEDTFQWVTDQDLMGYPGITAPPWNTPPTTDINQNCVQVLASGEFNDVSCTVNRPYICECDGYAPNAAHY